MWHLITTNHKKKQDAAKKQTPYPLVIFRTCLYNIIIVKAQKNSWQNGKIFDFLLKDHLLTMKILSRGYVVQYLPLLSLEEHLCTTAKEKTYTALVFRPREVGNPDTRQRKNYCHNNASEISESQNRRCTKQVKEGVQFVFSLFRGNSQLHKPFLKFLLLTEKVLYQMAANLSNAKMSQHFISITKFLFSLSQNPYVVLVVIQPPHIPYTKILHKLTTYQQQQSGESYSSTDKWCWTFWECGPHCYLSRRWGSLGQPSLVELSHMVRICLNRSVFSLQKVSIQQVSYLQYCT